MLLYHRIFIGLFSSILYVPIRALVSYSFRFTFNGLSIHLNNRVNDTSTAHNLPLQAAIIDVKTSRRYCRSILWEILACNDLENRGKPTMLVQLVWLRACVQITKTTLFMIMVIEYCQREPKINHTNKLQKELQFWNQVIESNQIKSKSNPKPIRRCCILTEYSLYAIATTNPFIPHSSLLFWPSPFLNNLGISIVIADCIETTNTLFTFSSTLNICVRLNREVIKTV